MTQETDVVSTFVKFWQEILAGAILLFVTWYTRLKGKKAQIFVTEKDLDMKLKLMQQDLLLQMGEKFDEHEEKLVARLKEIVR